MFEVPAAKRMKRSELSEHDVFDSLSLQDPDSEHNGVDEDDVAVDYGFEYDFIEQHPTTTSNDNRAGDDQPTEDTFQFNLFRPTPKPSQTQLPDKGPEAAATAVSSQRSQPQPQPAIISLRSPSPSAAGNPASLKFQTHRPDSYYFTASVSPHVLESLRNGYAQSAISATTIQRHASRPRPGSQLSWRVIRLPAHRKQIVLHKAGDISQPNINIKATSAPAPPNSADRGARARPSKKRRDLLKSKAQRRQRVIDASKTKEEHEKEKRNKKNRERKLKRRAKERREKEEARGGKGTAEVGDENGGDGEVDVEDPETD